MGSACAEIVHAMAPEAELYLARFDGSTGQAIRATEWLIDQGVTIINASWGTPVGRRDGLDLMSRFVNAVTEESGVLWVNAAGNEGERHWTGLSTDDNQDSLVDVPEVGDYLVFESAGENGRFRLSVTWDDWGTGDRPESDQDLDLYLVRVYPDGNAQIVAESTNPQSGAHEPIEWVVGEYDQAGEVYILALKIVDVDWDVRVHVRYAGDVNMFPVNPEYSVIAPGTAERSLTVAAVDIGTETLASYSSQGPTDDGRLKPEVAAPAGILSVAYDHPFDGTSASAPHVAGYASLLKSAGVSEEILRDRVIEWTREQGGSRPNNRYGNGHIDGSKAEFAQPDADCQQPGSSLSEVLDCIREKQKNN